MVCVFISATIKRFKVLSSCSMTYFCFTVTRPFVFCFCFVLNIEWIWTWGTCSRQLVMWKGASHHLFAGFLWETPDFLPVSSHLKQAVRQGSSVTSTKDRHRGRISIKCITPGVDFQASSVCALIHWRISHQTQSYILITCPGIYIRCPRDVFRHLQ